MKYDNNKCNQINLSKKILEWNINYTMHVAYKDRYKDFKDFILYHES